VGEDMRLERQIQEFYEKVPDMEDALPFKDYLIKHEDSRMAWYLLGKNYVTKGEEAKANYCFGQAGDIFEAFESKPLPMAPRPIRHYRESPQSERPLGRRVRQPGDDAVRYAVRHPRHGRSRQHRQGRVARMRPDEAGRSRRALRPRPDRNNRNDSKRRFAYRTARASGTIPAAERAERDKPPQSV
jgi:hypothetical protein